MNRIVLIVLALTALGGCVGAADEEDVVIQQRRPKSAQVVSFEEGDPSASGDQDYARAPVVLKIKPADETQGPSPEPWKRQEGPSPEPWGPKNAGEKP